MAEVQRSRVGAVEPGMVDSEQFLVWVLGDTGRDGGREEGRGWVIWVWSCHDPVRDFEISHIRSQGTDDRA